MAMFELNYTLQDVFSALVGVLIFPCVLIAPGYVTGWFFNLFEFKRRRLLAQLGIGLILSFAVSPIFFHLVSRLLSFEIALVFVAIFTVICFFLAFRSKFEFMPKAKILLWSGVAWSFFAILSLVNIQWEDQLFYSVTSYDQTTRVSLIDAITRTGIPPINPSYYPGQPVRLTFLYYFWYVLCSIVDVIGGKYVDARAALNASSVWIGIGLMILIAQYLRLRNSSRTPAIWNSVAIAAGLLVVSGLDVLPATLLMLRTGTIIGSIDVWNTWIQSWVASAFWVPHHLAAMIAGVCAILLVQFSHRQSFSKQITGFVFAGFAFASAVGLSIYVTLVFVVFWGIWGLILFLKEKDKKIIFLTVLSGGVALFLAGPFLFDLLRGGSGEANSFPIVFEVRSFLQLESFVADWSSLARSLIMLLVLPINYVFELGFFFIAGFYWFQKWSKETTWRQPYHLAELILICVVLFIGSTLRSTLITSNDLGWRAWLPGQFILLIWGTDVLVSLKIPKTHEEQKNKKLMVVFLVIGIVTTFADAVLLRSAWPLMTGPDAPKQYYSARMAYDYLRENIPSDAFTQNNPLISIDRPSGLYGAHQMVISDRTAYGVPQTEFDSLVREIFPIFNVSQDTSWQNIDGLCEKHSIDVLIFSDEDPAWSSMSILKMYRQPLYENEHYALFYCGE